MKPRYPALLSVVTLLMFGLSTNAWSQSCCQRVFRPTCKTCKAPAPKLPTCKVSCGYNSCKSCCANPLVDLLKRVDGALQRLLPCPKSCCKTACDAKPTYAKPIFKAKPTCGCGVPLVPLPSVPGETDPFRDDVEELQPPPVPTTEASHTPGDSKVARRSGHGSPTRAISISPERFRPMNALPLRTISTRQKSVLAEDASPESATSSTTNSSESKKRRPLLKSVRLAEFVLP